MKHSLLTLSILCTSLIFAMGVHAASLSVTTDTSWIEEMNSPGAFYHVRSGDITQLSPEDYLNRYRAIIGSPLLTINENLRQSAQNHANYLSMHGASQGDPHGQNPTQIGFTGQTPDARCSQAGYANYCTEVQAYGGGDMYGAIDSLMMTPFHRINMIHPGVTDIGCASAGGYVVCDLGLTVADYWAALGTMEEPFTYPANGQVISTTFLVNETPMPYPQYAGDFIGPTLMLWPTDGLLAPEAEVSLYDLTSKTSIETIVSINTSNPNAQNIVFFNPVSPLELDHEYAVRARDISGDNLFDEIWTFKTQQSSNVDFPNADQTITYDAHVNWADPSGAAHISSVPNLETAALIDRLQGQILLAVDHHGEAWYVDPITNMRYYLKDGPTAYEFLRSFGLGITNSDLASIPTETDAEGGGVLAEQLSGRILLQVEEHGEAWYINPADLKRYYMANGAEAYRIMRELSLGTELLWINGIPIGQVLVQ
jgi:hypothetical protein